MVHRGYVFAKDSGSWGLSGPFGPKRRERGQYRDSIIRRLALLEEEGWTLVYIDGSAKQVRGWWQAGYGAWFGEGKARNIGAPVPIHERQSVSRGELRGILYALERRQAREKMVVILDSEYVSKGVTEWSVKCHGWRVQGGGA